MVAPVQVPNVPNIHPRPEPGKRPARISRTLNVVSLDKFLWTLFNYAIGACFFSVIYLIQGYRVVACGKFSSL